jgi:hypothetical protein
MREVARLVAAIFAHMCNRHGGFDRLLPTQSHCIEPFDSQPCSR